MEKIQADAAQVKEQGYQQGRTDTLGYLRKVLMTLANEFQDDRYFEAYLHYMDECQWAAIEDRDPEQVELIPPSVEGEDAGDEATKPLEAEAEASKEKEHEVGGEPDV